MSALETHMPAGVTWTRPDRCLFFCVRLPDQFDGGELLQRSISDAGVAFVPGAAFFTDGTGRNTRRLSYSLPNETQTADGIARLGKLIASAA